MRLNLRDIDIVLIMKRARKPFCDATETPRLCKRERAILNRLSAGEQLLIVRLYHTDKQDDGRDGRTYIVNHFFWDRNDPEDDGPVWMLLRRGLIRPTGAAGGAQWFVICR